MVLGDGVISPEWMSEASDGCVCWPAVNSSSQPGQETNLLNFYSSIGSQPSPNISSISLKCETHCQVLPARVAVQAVSDVIAEAFSKIVHKLSSLQRVGRKGIKPTFSPWQLLGTGPGHSPGWYSCCQTSPSPPLEAESHLEQHRAKLHPDGPLPTFLHGKTQTAPLGIINSLKPVCLIKFPQNQTNSLPLHYLHPTRCCHIYKHCYFSKVICDFKAQPAATHSTLTPAVSPPPSKLLWLLFPHWFRVSTVK